MTGPPASLSPAPRQLQVGQLGILPSPPKMPARGPRLTVPAGIVPVPGRYPLGTQVRFQLPVRNDGDAELIIERLVPGWVCTQASVRSHRLPPGQQTLIDVAFSTTIDGPGRHGEVIDVAGNDPRLTNRRPLQHDLAFIITVTAAAASG